MTDNTPSDLERRDWEVFACRYEYDGYTRVLTIPAKDREDAEARLKAISTGYVAGRYQNPEDICECELDTPPD